MNSIMKTNVTCVDYVTFVFRMHVAPVRRNFDVGGPFHFWVGRGLRRRAAAVTAAPLGRQSRGGLESADEPAGRQRAGSTLRLPGWRAGRSSATAGLRRSATLVGVDSLIRSAHGLPVSGGVETPAQVRGVRRGGQGTLALLRAFGNATVSRLRSAYPLPGAKARRTSLPM